MADNLRLVKALYKVPQRCLWLVSLLVLTSLSLSFYLSLTHSLTLTRYVPVTCISSHFPLCTICIVFCPYVSFVSYFTQVFLHSLVSLPFYFTLFCHSKVLCINLHSLSTCLHLPCIDSCHHHVPLASLHS